MKVKENIEKAGLKLKIQKMKTIASGPITSWQIDRGTMEAVRDFSFLGSRISVDGDCKYEIQRHLLFERKASTNLDSILKKQRTRWPRRMWSKSLSTDPSGIHLQTQKCMQNTS